MGKQAVTDRYGELLFGRRIRLRVLLWTDAQGQRVFNQSEAARGIDYTATGEVGKELDRLVELGMLRKFSRSGNMGPQRYVRIEHLGWGIARAVRAAVDGDNEANVATIPDTSSLEAV